MYSPMADTGLGSSLASPDNEPPRKKMRKGTKSCVECRRRKIRCTFNPSRPNRCNECFSRGSSCIDQEHAPVDTFKPSVRINEPSYSLRERVAALENTVESLVKQLQAGGKDSTDGAPLRPPLAPEPPHYPRNTYPPSPSEPPESVQDGQTERAPLLSLFDNHLVVRSKPVEEQKDPRAARDQSSKYAAIRSRLISLLPPLQDVQTILQSSDKFHVVQLQRYPEISTENLPSLLADGSQNLTPEVLGDLSKLLILLVTALDLHSPNLDPMSLKQPLNVTSFSENVLSFLDEMIFTDEPISSTLSGIECFLFACRYYMSAGRPRKAWRLIRRGIESAQLLGFHLSTNSPASLTDRLGFRKLFTWCSLVSCDRYLSLIMGLPYIVADRDVAPHMLRLVQSPLVLNPEKYILRLTIFVGGLVDRNQDPTKMSLSKTLELEQELETASMIFSTPGSEHVPGITLVCRFLQNFMRVMLYLPFVLSPDADHDSRYLRDAAVQSSRDCLKCYDRIRNDLGAEFTVCKMIDFQLFTAAIVLGIRLLNIFAKHPEECVADWALLRRTTQILRAAAVGPYGSVAAHSAEVLEMLCDGCDPAVEAKNDHSNGCKVTIPYFGTFYLRAGIGFENPKAEKRNSTCQNGSASFISPPTSTPHSAVTPSSTLEDGTSAYPPFDDQSVSFSNIVSLPNVDFDMTKIPNMINDMGLRVDPPFMSDLGLDQGWNFDWFNPSNPQIS